MTDQPRTIMQALASVMRDVQAVGKDGFNTNQKYKFRGIDAVVNAVGPAFREHGVIATPEVETNTFRDVKTSGGKPSRECTLTVRYRFYGPAGDFIEAVVPGESMDSGDKGAAKAMSVAYRIALLQVLCIPTDDPDPDESSYERAEPMYERVDPSDEAKELMNGIRNATNIAALLKAREFTEDGLKSHIITPAEHGVLIRAADKRQSELKFETQGAS
jgi:ERF superfamily